MSSRALKLIIELAEGQGGYFTTPQASDSGLSARVLSYHTTNGDLERVAHGVYRWVHFPEHRFGDVIAATVWAGADAAASHETALSVYGLAAAMPPVIHVTTPHRFRGQRRGVVIHQASLSRAEVRRYDAVPVTTPVRTLLDVARSGDPSLARQATADALEQGLIRPRRLASAVDTDPEAERLREVLGHSLPEVARP
ncbi:MAG: type IV toxin-antitoxin system AbiEi family antitoxin domain-containing protein [Haloechinothrix sp.]